MDHVERLAQVFAGNDKRDVGLECTLCNGDDAHAATAQGTEQLARYARTVAHLLAHDGHGGQSALGNHGIHGSCGYFLGKLLVEHLYRLVGIRLLDGYRGGVF